MIQFTDIRLDADLRWVFTWTAIGASVYRVTLFGVQIGTTTTPNFTVDLGATKAGFDWSYYPPPIEVVEDNTKASSEAYPPYDELQWYGEDCAYYDVRLYDGTTWNSVQTQDESGQWIYSYDTPRLVDETTYLYEVVAVDAIGDESDPQEFQINVVTPPVLDERVFKVTYDNATTAITIVPQ